jgi:Cu-Zn family superoxide dismutase
LELIVRSPALRLICGPLLAVALLAAGCGADPATDAASQPPQQPTGVPTPSSAPSAPEIRSNAGGAGEANTFEPYRIGANAITYDPAIVPAGATAKVITTSAGAGVKVRLVVTGLKPRRAYGAHLHTDPCADTADAAGPHYQHMPDPKAVASPPSVDPKFANPNNEVWLDFTTDAIGSATTTATQRCLPDPAVVSPTLPLCADAAVPAAVRSDGTRWREGHDDRAGPERAEDRVARPGLPRGVS